MDDRRSQSRHAITTEGLNFGIDRILKNDTESGKYIVLIISRGYTYVLYMLYILYID